MSNDYCPCKLPYRPSAGHEDMQEHSTTAGRVFYTVGVGFVRGIYTDEYITRQQVTRYSDGKWKKSATYKEAVAIWNQMYEHYHHHEKDHYSDSSPPASPPPPSPSPSPVPHTPVWSFAPPAIRVAHQASLPLSPRSTIPEAVYIRGSPCPSSSKSAGMRGSVRDPVASSSRHRQSSTPPLRVQPRRTGSEWREGETLWGIEGVPLLFEDRYNAVDHISAKRLSPVRIMETCNHRKLEAFVEKRRIKVGDAKRLWIGYIILRQRYKTGNWRWFVVLCQDTGGVWGGHQRPTASSAPGIPSIKAPGVHGARDLGSMTPEVEGWVFREFRVRERRVFQLVEELEATEIDADGVQGPEFFGHGGTRKLRVVELI
ncbi:hypothetical protein B0H14DRAFT_3679417 [Mycena olivaceomarginata]|nr:hypothetical protein B0H14DRAFT_3679417 [Mycena olivaceomarginata]